MTNANIQMTTAHGADKNSLNESADTSVQAAAQSPLFVGSVQKAISVLRAFGRSKGSLSLSEISAATGIGKSAAQRYCYTLVALGLLERDASSRRMSPTVRLLEFSHSFLVSDPISSLAAPYLLQAREKSGQAINLALPLEPDVIYISRLPSATSHMANPLVGGRAPMFCTSSGRAYLSTLSDERISEILDESDLRQLTKNTITDRDEIMKSISDVRNYGYTTAIQECIDGELTIAAPIFGHDQIGVGAVNICVTMPSWSLEKVLKDLAPIVSQMAHDISAVLVGSPMPRK